MCRPLLTGRPFILAMLIGLLVAAQASADPITLSGGISVNAHEGPFYNLSGPGFSLTGATLPLGFGFEGSDFYTFCGTSHYGCFPGEQLQMSGATVGELSLGLSRLTINGNTYDGVRASLDGSFDAPSRIVPSFAGDYRIELEAPFTFNGTLRVTGTADQELLFRSATGSGTAVARLIWGQDRYEDENQRIQYNFDSQPAPVPEPATMILLGTGLVGTLVRARRTRRRAA